MVWDFLVSCTQADRPWAEWIAWTLEDAGYRVLIQAWDFIPGSNWVTGMDQGAAAERTIAVLSAAYTRSVYGAAEWQAAWSAGLTGAVRKLLLARVEDCPRPGLLGQVVSFDLFGIPQDTARANLLRAADLAVSSRRAKPTTAAPFPTGAQAPAPPPFPTVQPGASASTPAAGGIHIGSVTAPDGQAIGLNYGQVWQQRFTGPFALLRDVAIPLDPLPGDLRLIDAARPDNPVARFRGRTDLIATIDAYLQRCVQQRRGGYLLIEAEAGMGKSALATYLAFTRTWPAHFTRLTEGRSPEAARLNLAAQLIARWKLDAAPGGVLPDNAATPRWLYLRLCDAARTRDNDTEHADQPVVLLVDGLDEAPTPPPGELPLGLPTSLPPGTIIVATTRPKTLTIPTSTRVIERIDVESTSNRTDLLDYLITLSTTDPLIVDALRHAGMSASRFSQTLLDRSGGVWIYALTVLDQIRDHGRNPTDIDQLPQGLAGYYADNLHRWQHELGDTAWQTHGLPVLATLTAIREPQTATTIATWAGVPEPDTRTLLRGIFRPFLATRTGGDPDLYQPRHQSLRDFLHGATITIEEDHDLRHLSHALKAATENANDRITASLIPPGEPGQRTWKSISEYTRSYLSEHAVDAGTLDDLVHDPGFLLACHPASIFAQQHKLTTSTGVAAINAFALFHDEKSEHFDDSPVWRLHVWARKVRADALADIAGRWAKRPWTIQAAIWNGTVHRIFPGHTDWVRALASLPGPGGTTLLASAGLDTTVRLWNPITGAPAAPPLTGHTDWVTALAAVPGPDNTTLLASASTDETIRLWNPITGQPAAPPLTGHTGPVNALAAVPGPDSTTLLASASTDETIRLWNPITGQPAAPPLTGHTGPVTALAAVPGPDSTTLLASASAFETTVRLWNPITGQPAAPPLTGHTGPVNALAAVPRPDNTTLLASAGLDETIRLWNPTTGTPARPPLTGHTSPVNALAALPGPDGTTLLATASDDQTVRLWNPTTGTPARPPLTGHTSPVNALAALPGPDGTTLLATASIDESVRLWNPITGEPAGPPLTDHTSPVNALAALPGPDGTALLATASSGFVGPMTIRLWDPTTGQPAGPPITSHARSVNSLAVLPGSDGTIMLATASLDEGIRLWNLTTGQPAGPAITGHPGRVTAVAALPGPDGIMLLASVSIDGGYFGSTTIRLWNPATGQPAGPPITSHARSVNSLAVLPGSDGTTLLATASAFETRIWLWNPITGQPAGPPLTGHTSPVNALAVLSEPEGTSLLASASDDREIFLWAPAKPNSH